jgi:hypothetical protein
LIWNLENLDLVVLAQLIGEVSLNSSILLPKDVQKVQLFTEK